MSTPPDVLDTGLTREESKQIVTPYAFGVADELVGTPLASPWQRGIALLIDLGLIGLLTTVSSLILALVSAWAFWRAGNKMQHKKRFAFGRKLMRLIGAILLFVVAIGLFEMLDDEQKGAAWNPFKDKGALSSGQDKQDFSTTVEIAALSVKYLMEAEQTSNAIKSGECEPAYDCWLPVAKSFAQDLAEQSIPDEQALGLMNGIVEEVTYQLSAPQQQQLRDEMRAEYQLLKGQQHEDEPKITEKVVASVAEPEDKDFFTVPNNEEGNPSILAWLQGIVSDLGIGFGWAALYFTAFTAWWKGQTPGKKLLGIRVVKLDGHVMTTWESFERYGGYGAGIATGLLGFLQIFWDLNRQAIHDKISETLVIKGQFNIQQRSVLADESQGQEESVDATDAKTIPRQK